MSKSSKSERMVDQIWNFFASVKLSVVILLSIAATSIVGTVVPQNENPGLYLNNYGEFLFSVFNALGVFDLYHSGWFRFLMCLLIINLVVCSINRLNATWRIIFPKTPQFQAGRFKNAGSRQEWTMDAPTDRLKNVYESYISGHFSVHRTDATENGFIVYAEKGRWTRLGVYAVHASVILMVIGGLIGSIWGFEGFANIPEGESAGKITLTNQDSEKDLGFLIRCNKFSIALYDSGMPKEYRSSLTILKKDQEMVTQDILVNTPLKVEGVSIFQSSYGKIPGKSFTVKFIENDSEIEYVKKASMGEEIPLPGNSGILVVEDFKASFSFRGVTLENIFLCRLSDASGETENIILPVDFPRFDKMRGGKFIISISDVEYKYYTGLQVSRDPGVPVVYAGFLLMILGCYVTFFMFHQQFCVELSRQGGQTRVTVSGISGKNKPGMLVKTRRFARRLKKTTERPE
ncbi:MAG: cytochrome c biogenesis protein ResB [Desulfobacterales bacterium]|jgi:cytochrome c biogenesis protein|nr:cytochrome c biogenesis protein ResB [Desulfobacterales bacterium]